MHATRAVNALKNTSDFGMFWDGTQPHSNGARFELKKNEKAANPVKFAAVQIIHHS